MPTPANALARRNPALRISGGSESVEEAPCPRLSIIADPPRWSGQKERAQVDHEKVNRELAVPPLGDLRAPVRIDPPGDHDDGRYCGTGPLPVRMRPTATLRRS